jgi:hypothetical protein
MTYIYMPPADNVFVERKFGQSGEYMCRVWDVKDDQLTLANETDWFSNLITDTGLDRLAVGAAGAFLRCGTGTAAPTFADTQLVAQLASTSTVFSTSDSFGGAPDYQSTRTTTFRFAQGAVVGNVAELGLGWVSTGAGLYSRALVLDGVGTPTSVAVNGTQIFEVAYRHALYPNLADASGVVSISGVNYNYVSRLSSRDTTRQPAVSAQWFAVNSAFFYPGNIGLITGFPSGGQVNGAVAAASAYVNGNFYLDFPCSLGLTAVSGGIRSMMFNAGWAAGSLFSDQFRFGKVSDDTTIPKTAVNQFSIPIRVSWARR